MGGVSKTQHRLLLAARDRRWRTWPKCDPLAVAPTNIGEWSACEALRRNWCFVRDESSWSYQITQWGLWTLRQVEQQIRNAERARRLARAA